MNDLVEVKNNEIWVESHLVARKMNVKHGRFMEKVGFVTSNLKRLRGTNLSPKFKIETRNYRGKEFEVCLMNRPFFSLVMMRFESAQAFDWQVKFNDAFYMMEKRLLQVETNKSDIEWTQTRLIGKTARRSETDAISRFKEYAISQGSKGAKFYFKHITNATYKALGLMSQKHPKLRDQMNIYEVSELMLAERLATNKLIEYMDSGMHYKKIYEQIKTDLISFAESIRLSHAVTDDIQDGLKVADFSPLPEN